MSEVIKLENECQFDPKQYECHSVVAPVGSFSWALIQLKLRKLVARSVWRDKKMYLAITPRVNDLTVEEGSAYVVDGVAVGTKYDYLTHIDLRNEHGNFVPWQPTQEDMMACDWEFVGEKPVKPKPHIEPAYQLKARLTVGKASSMKTEYFGYANKLNYSLGYSMGKWEEISNNTLLLKNIIEFDVAHTASTPPNCFVIHVEDNSSKIKEQFGSKRLIVKCLGKEYDLGVAETKYLLTLLYTKTDDSSELEALFVESVGKTLEIELNFFDE
ncbi:DUF2829 domain-containing protein [Photorhabdus laumondii subsp. laumondii]|uniref:Photorhabdus luminescens subsp. laumondii TTO1 complete genome segment 7/17 n=2 Tax=Photorhabdus laumondii subsp. laumondii TaxID=141679 RepID=Q7N5J8_PHOLL|nr:MULTISPECIES: DUF2829 domain-containing protein [Photorhabdus]AWK41753.1 hypothetical protein A4R40_09765 [Photorhabdus laumondii subsp. laumondii]AXG42572.1 DUF2829 domain-containing protein [Photorhabdus laumondii subsp. laumondii]AXG47074.1 DUF2829 domain-containing protein [Photorhabdus laumondii subsp. laumondii]KTL60957.1 hypothetical protein AA106_10845 [Photorhabdus laumondii subsp. laumondii]MCC8382490.1 DUF2829 domain-containing protein [Photorhabdus laumondii]